MSAHNPGADGAADHLAYLGGHPEDRVSARDEAAEIVRKLRGYNTYDSTKMRHNTPQVCLEAADTIEALVQDNERLQKIEQRAGKLLGVAMRDPCSPECSACWAAKYILWGDQLQGGENLSERFERLAADPGLEERSRRVRDSIRQGDSDK